MSKILVVDDEEALLRLITHNLQREGYQTVTAADGLSALEILQHERPDLIILDLMLPGVSGLEICRRLRQEKYDVPILMLTARDEEIDKVLGLEMGADDYVTKPFGVRELLARVKAILRRRSVLPAQEQQHIYRSGPIAVNMDAYQAYLNDEQVELTLKEFELLSLLIRNQGRVLKRDYILDTIWGYDVETGSRVLDVHISKLREKLEEDTRNPRYIKTIRGIGYKFEEKSDD
ncbi:MAG: response regulator transcription factor [Methylocystaceae bacterium]